MQHSCPENSLCDWSIVQGRYLEQAGLKINMLCHEKNDMSLLNMPNRAGLDNDLSPIVPLRGPVDVIGVRFLHLTP